MTWGSPADASDSLPLKEQSSMQMGSGQRALTTSTPSSGMSSTPEQGWKGMRILESYTEADGQCLGGLSPLVDVLGG